MNLNKTSLTFNECIQKAEYYINDELDRNYEKALKYLEEALILNPVDSLLFSKMGYCCMQLSDYKSAVVFFKKSIYFNKENPITYFNLALCLDKLEEDYNLIEKNYIKSIEYAKEELVKCPTNYSSLKNIADAYYNLELYENSQEYYEQYLKYDLNSEVLEYLAFSYLYKEQYDIYKSLELFKKAIKLSDNLDTKSHLYRTMININYYDLEKYEEVINIYLKLIDIADKKDKSLLYFQIAEVYRADLKEYDNAIKYYHKSIEYDDKYEQAYTWLACTHNYKKEHEIALEYFLKAKDLEPESIIVYNNLVYVYSDLGMYDKVEENLKKALEIDPEYDPSLIAMLEVNLILGKEFDRKTVKTLLEVYKNDKVVMGEYNMLRILKLAVDGKDIKKEVRAWENKYEQLRQGYSVVPIIKWAEKSDLALKEDILDALKIFKKES